MLTPVEIKFVLWFCGTLLSMFAFIGALGVNQLMKIAKDLNEMKVSMGRLEERGEQRHVAHDERITRLEKQVA